MEGGREREGGREGGKVAKEQYVYLRIYNT